MMPLTEKASRSVSDFNILHKPVCWQNRHKVPAEEGVFHLVIGLGGLGTSGLLEAKKLINRTCCQRGGDQPTDQVAYLAMDTDMGASKMLSDPRTGSQCLDPAKNEFLLLFQPNMRRIFAPEFRHRVPSYISSWLDFNVFPQFSVESDIIGVRQIGRLQLFGSADKVLMSLKWAMEHMIASKKVNRLNIHILTSVSGGTGSGTFLDVAYMARDLAKQSVGTETVRVDGYLFMPDVCMFDSAAAINQRVARQNGYAALKELDYLMNLPRSGGRFTQKYTDTYEIDTQKAPFDYVYLISGLDKNGRVDLQARPHALETAARHLCASVAENQDGLMKMEATEGVLLDYHSVAECTPNRYPEREDLYLALGSCGCELPRDLLLLDAFGLVFDKMEALLARQPDQQEADRAVKALGLGLEPLFAMLVGKPCNLMALGMVHWEDLFGSHPKYNYQKKCEKWMQHATEEIRQRAQEFGKNFQERFRKNCEAWFTDSAFGPVWVHRLIVSDTPDCHGLLACLRRDARMACDRMAELQRKLTQAQMQVRVCAEEALHTPALLGDRQGRTLAYIQALNTLANCCAELTALQELCGETGSSGLLGLCTRVVTAEDKSRFEVAADVMDVMHKTCLENKRHLLEPAPQTEAHGIAWQPLSVQALAPEIRRTMEQPGVITGAVDTFLRALMEESRQWDGPDVNGKRFLTHYLNDCLGDMVDRSLEGYGKNILDTEELRAEVEESLAPRLVQGAVPNFGGSTGMSFTLLFVPEFCRSVGKAISDWVNFRPDRTTWIRDYINPAGDAILAQTLLVRKPLYEYGILEWCEQAYLQTNSKAGLHLYKDWVNLPSPIPARGRSESEGYPEAIKQVEDRQRELYRECRNLPILVRKDSGSRIVYSLQIAELPDLDARFPAEQLQGQSDRLEEAIQQIDRWMTEGMSALEWRHETYEVAVMAATEADPETVAQECFLGEYDNLCRAEQELEKYHALAQKRQELEQLAQA